MILETRLHDFSALFKQLTTQPTPRTNESLKILDIGCGNGVFTRLTVGEGRTVFGVDVSQNLIKHAVERYPPINGCVASCYELPFADCTFDIVLSLGLLQMVSDRWRCIQQMVRVLKPGGTGLIEFLPKWNLLDVLARMGVDLIKRDWPSLRNGWQRMRSTGRPWRGDFNVTRSSPSWVKNAILRAGATRARIISKRWFFFNAHYTTIVFSR